MFFSNGKVASGRLLQGNLRAEYLMGYGLSSMIAGYGRFALLSRFSLSGGGKKLKMDQK